MRKSPPITIQEIPGDQYADLKDAQRAALPLLADNLQAVVMDLLERGALINDHGKIIPNHPEPQYRGGVADMLHPQNKAQHEKSMQSPNSGKNLPKNPFMAKNSGGIE